MSASIGAARAARLLVGLRLRRILNQLGTGLQWPRQRRKAGSEQTGEAKRTATPGKAKLGWLLAGFIGIAMVFGVANLAVQALSNMETALGSTQARPSATAAPSATQPQRARRVPLPPAAGNTLPAGVLQAVALEVVVLFIAAFLLSLGSRDLAQPDWDIEWLVTLPMALSTLLAVRIAERTIVNVGLLLLWPFLTVVAWWAGYRFGALPLAFLATLPFLAISATLRTLIDTGLRLSVSPAKLRNLQAVMSVAAVLFMYLGMSAAYPPGGYVVEWAASLPAWAFWLPPGLATIALTSTEPATIGYAWLGLALQAGVVAAVGLAVTMRLLRQGVVAAGARESGRRPAARPTTAPGSAGPETRRLLSPVQARELRLLSRDRNFLVQSLVLPVLIIGAQYWFNMGGEAFAAASRSPQGLAAIAFSIAAYALMFSAFQTLNTEGNALWILYSIPQPIEAILRQKAILWGIVCLVYPLAIFAFALMSGGGGAPIEVMGLAIVVLAGVPIFAVIATSLGVFACDPLAQVVQRRLRPSYMYLYMLLASLYVYSIFASTVWQRAGLMVLTALLALALWQKARDHLPYLLDPSASPPARVSLSDGMIAALLFFVVQALVGLIFALNDQKLTGRELLIAFAAAGATTFLLMRFAYWRLKPEGVPRALGPGSGRAAGWGVVGGAAAALGAFVYLYLAANTPLLQQAQETVLVGVEDQLWIAVLAVAAAPFFEEFIFRGLIYGGLRRTLGVTASVLASAAIFAIVHPPAGVIPVFGLGVAAALVYERTRLLIGPIVVHAVYNAAVVGLHFLSG